MKTENGKRKTENGKLKTENGKVNFPTARQILLAPNLSLECGSRCASQKKPLWDSSKTYSPKGFTFRDVQLMPYYNDKVEYISL